MGTDVVASAAIFCVHFGWPVAASKAVSRAGRPESVDSAVVKCRRSAGPAPPWLSQYRALSSWTQISWPVAASRQTTAHSRRAALREEPIPITTNDDQAGPIFSCQIGFGGNLPQPSRFAFHELRRCDPRRAGRANLRDAARAELSRSDGPRGRRFFGGGSRRAAIIALSAVGIQRH